VCCVHHTTERERERERERESQTARANVNDYFFLCVCVCVSVENSRFEVLLEDPYFLETLILRITHRMPKCTMTP
jgi:hypothetical protein